MLTLKDIAEEAGVSTVTVSNVINGKMSRVSRENATRIIKIIQKRRYVPNSSARTLAAKSSRIIAGVLLGGRGANMLKDPYNAEFFGELVCAVQERGYYLMIRYENSYEGLLQSLRSWNVDGAVFVGTPDAYINKIRKDIQIPLIFTDSYAKGKGSCTVCIDDFKGGRLAAEHFLDKGHVHLGFVGYGLQKQEKNVVTERFNGFMSALKKRGVSVRKERRFYVADGDPSDDIQKIAARLKAEKNGITGVFVSADKLAIALMKALLEQGVRIPSDISVIGYDDLSSTSIISPELTTIRQDIGKKAQIATDLLFSQIEGRGVSTLNTVLDVALIERNSVRQN